MSAALHQRTSFLAIHSFETEKVQLDSIHLRVLYLKFKLGRFFALKLLPPVYEIYGFMVADFSSSKPYPISDGLR